MRTIRHENIGARHAIDDTRFPYHPTFGTTVVEQACVSTYGRPGQLHIRPSGSQPTVCPDTPDAALAYPPLTRALEPPTLIVLYSASLAAPH